MTPLPPGWRISVFQADLDLRTVYEPRRQFDPAGHYHRPDVFDLTVDTRPRPAVTRLGP